MPRIRFKEGIKITSGIENKELVKAEVRQLSWFKVNRRKTDTLQSSLACKNLRVSCWSSSPQLWCGPGTGGQTSLFKRCANIEYWLEPTRTTIIISISSPFFMSQSELIQLPFTRLEFHRAMAYPLISTQYEFYQSYTATLKSWFVFLRALKDRFTIF